MSLSHRPSTMSNENFPECIRLFPFFVVVQITFQITFIIICWSWFTHQCQYLMAIMKSARFQFAPHSPSGKKVQGKQKQRSQRGNVPTNECRFRHTKKRCEKGIEKNMAKFETFHARKRKMKHERAKNTKAKKKKKKENDQTITRRKYG